MDARLVGHGAAEEGQAFRYVVAQHRDARPAGHHSPPPEVEAQVQGSVKPAGQVGGGLPRLDVGSNRIWLGRAGEAWEGAHLDGLQRWMMPPDRLAPGTEPG